MAKYPSYKALLNRYNSASDEVKNYFPDLPLIIGSTTLNAPWEICLGYMFVRVETAQTMTLYCGVVKKYHVDSDLASRTIHIQHITRDSFKAFFKEIFRADIPSAVLSHLEAAQEIRDKVLHGKIRSINVSSIREAIGGIIDFADGFNIFVNKTSGFEPFGDLRGFTDKRSKPLDKTSSRLLLKGLGFKLR